MGTKFQALVEYTIEHRKRFLLRDHLILEAGLTTNRELTAVEIFPLVDNTIMKGWRTMGCHGHVEVIQYALNEYK